MNCTSVQTHLPYKSKVSVMLRHVRLAGQGSSRSIILYQLHTGRLRRDCRASMLHPRRLCQALGDAAASLEPQPQPQVEGQGSYTELVQGKRFMCTECGKCCTGAGEVWASLEECAGIARLLGLSRENFLAKYTKSYSRRPGWRLLRHARGSQDCIFLVNGTKCSIYRARPLQCATYPWWPELMDPDAWTAEGLTVCEGISHAEAAEVDMEAKGEVLRLATGQHLALQAAAAGVRKKDRGGHGVKQG